MSNKWVNPQPKLVPQPYTNLLTERDIALDRLAGGRLFLYGGGRPGAAQSAQKNASCSL